MDGMIDLGNQLPRMWIRVLAAEFHALSNNISFINVTYLLVEILTQQLTTNTYFMFSFISYFNADSCKAKFEKRRKLYF
jgi:hypothetical protein